MATGRGTQLTRQIGEHLVAAELGRLGYIAAPFAGNVPLYDLMAADSQDHAIPIQAKAINKGSWQYSVDTFLNIEVENGQQVVKGNKKLPNPNLICIFVLLKGRGKDEFSMCFASATCRSIPRGFTRGAARIPKIQTLAIAQCRRRISAGSRKTGRSWRPPWSLQVFTLPLNTFNWLRLAIGYGSTEEKGND